MSDLMGERLTAAERVRARGRLVRARRKTLAVGGQTALLLAAAASATSMITGRDGGPSLSFVVQCFALGVTGLAALRVRRLRAATPAVSVAVPAGLVAVLAIELVRTGTHVVPLLVAGAGAALTALAVQLAHAPRRGLVVGAAVAALVAAATLAGVRGAELAQLGLALAFAGGVALVAAQGLDASRARRERQDIARRRAVARERRTMAAREEMVANVSHDVRNPLAIALGFAEMAADAELPAEERAQALAGVRRSLWEISQLVENVLDGSADRAGALEPTRQPVALDELCRDALASTQVLLRTRPITLAGSIEPGLSVIADRHRLTRVLGNLLGNACKYTERGEIRLEAVRRGDAAVVRVSDTGPGIAPTELPYIFDRFRRANDGGRGGVGLGLAIAHRLAERMGGTLEVESTPGTGSTFSLTLPLAAAERTPAAA
jgi:signal transduction histidine kinase